MINNNNNNYYYIHFCSLTMLQVEGVCVEGENSDVAFQCILDGTDIWSQRNAFDVDDIMFHIFGFLSLPERLRCERGW